jgi:hypothetical protein
VHARRVIAPKDFRKSADFHDLIVASVSSSGHLELTASWSSTTLKLKLVRCAAGRWAVAVSGHVDASGADRGRAGLKTAKTGLNSMRAREL